MSQGPTSPATRLILIYECRWPSTERGNYAALFEDLAKTIREGKEPVVKWAESAEVIEIIELAYQSAREGRTVTIPPRP